MSKKKSIHTQLPPTSEIKSAVALTPEQVREKSALREEQDARALGSHLWLNDRGDIESRKPWGGVSTLAMPPEFSHTAEQASALAAERGVPWREEYAGRLVHYWASDERVDGHGDIVRQDWRFDLFKDNPAMPYSHRWEDPTIGTHLDWKVLKRSDANYKGPALALLSLFATAEQSEFADSIFRLVSAKMLRAGSVGFSPGRVIWVEDKEERNKLGLGNWGYVLEDNMLLEFSPTTLGANPGAGVMNALAAAKSRGIVRASEFQVLRELRRREVASGSRSGWAEEDAELVRLGRLLFPGEPIEEHRDLDAALSLIGLEMDVLRGKSVDVGDVPAKEHPEEQPTDQESEPEPQSLDEKILALSSKIDLLCDAVEELRSASQEVALSLQRQMDEVRDHVEDIAAKMEIGGELSNASDFAEDESESAALDERAIGRALLELERAG